LLALVASSWISMLTGWVFWGRRCAAGPAMLNRSGAVSTLIDSPTSMSSGAPSQRRSASAPWALASAATRPNTASL